MISFTIFGSVHDSATFFCEALVKRMTEVDSGSQLGEFNVMFEVEFLVKLEELKKAMSLCLSNKTTHLVLKNNQLLGDMNSLIELAKSEPYNIDDAEAFNTIVYNRSVRELSYTLMSERGRPVVYFDFIDATGGKTGDSLHFGKVHVELFEELCPKACENFIKLIEGARLPGAGRKAPLLQYKNCPIHRLVKDGWMQCGDVMDGTGENSSAVLDPSGTVADESFSVDFGSPLGGILGLANNGAHTNGSQFFITLGPCEWMNSKFVGIGRVVQGFDVLRAVNKIPTQNQKPTRKIVVDTCGKSLDL